jgi:predicted nucleotidyltransferase
MTSSPNRPLPIAIPQDQISDFCRRHNIHKLSLFGSVLRQDFTPDSDVDFLVEFVPGKTPGYLGLAGMEIELTEIIGRKADLRTPQELSPYFREEVLREAVLQYDQN